MFDKRLLALLGKDKKYIVFIVILNLLQTIINIVFTFCIVFIVNYHYKNVYVWERLSVPFYVMIGTVVLKFILIRLTGHFQAVLGSNAKVMLRRMIYDKASKLGVRETDDLSLASITQVATEGVEQLDLYYSTYVPQFFFAMMSPFILFGLLMFISIPCAVVLLICVPLIPMSIIAVSKYAKKIFATYWGEYTRMGDSFLDNISGMTELKIYNADEARHKNMNDTAEDFRKVTMKVLTMQLASTTIMDLVAYGGAGLGIGISLLTRKSINPLFDLELPSLILFIVLVAVDFFLPLRALGSAFHVSMNGATAGKKILKLLDTKEPVWGKDTADSKSIEMKDITFSYDGSRNILDHVSLTFPENTITSVVGKSGSGKSTIITLLKGLKPDYEGTILIGDKNIKNVSRESYYKIIGSVSYNSYLFNDTVRNNFKLVKKDITDEEIMNYLRMVHLDDFIHDLGGLDLVLNEDSKNISGGQRQRLALAVNLVSDKPVYFFDEVTSNIDKESEEIIMDNIYKLKEKKTIIMISHRLKNAEKSDNIYVLDEGKIQEAGTHSELLSKNGLYAEMLHTQLQLEEGYHD